jgi:hypothetical protein
MRFETSNAKAAKVRVGSCCEGNVARGADGPQRQPDGAALFVTKDVLLKGPLMGKAEAGCSDITDIHILKGGCCWAGAGVV